MNYIKLILKKSLLYYIVINIMISCSVSTALAAFGAGCASLPTTSAFQAPTINRTAYGLIKENIDIKNHIPDECNVGNNILKFCIKIKNPEHTITPDIKCTLVTMNLGAINSITALTTNPDLVTNDIIGNIKVKVSQINSKLCLVMPTEYGEMPIICRNMKSHTGLSSTNEINETLCRTLGDSCYDNHNRSQFIFNFSGRIIDCVRSSLNKIFYTKNQCRDFNLDVDHTTDLILASLPEFQKSLEVAVNAALILYVIFFGFKILLNREYMQFKHMTSFVLKLIFVAYFTLGLSSVRSEYTHKIHHNGMTEFALPILTTMTNDFANFVFSAVNKSGLCVFDSSKYKIGYEFYQLWDSIDCRVGYYLGLNEPLLRAYILKTRAESIDDGNAPEGTEKFFGFISFIVGLWMNGGIIAVLMGAIFVGLLISIIFRVIVVYLLSIITLYGMAYISPIFIPMILFERTKSYFESWLKIVVSCTLQPAVMTAFLVLFLTMYDSVIYGNCEFMRHELYAFSVFELMVPEINPESCISSLGYKVKHYLQGGALQKIKYLLFEFKRFNDYLNITINLVYAVTYTALFYYFMQLANKFAANLTSGIQAPQIQAFAPPKKAPAAQKESGDKESGDHAASGKESGDHASSSKRSGDRSILNHAKSSDRIGK